MSKLEFLEKLEVLLADIPYTERREALNYYTEYFDDAECSEEEVIAKLGSPEEAAHNIRVELADKEIAVVEEAKNAEHTQNTENGTAYNDSTSTGKKEKTKLEGWQIALIVVGIILVSPVWLPIVGGAGGFLIGIAAAYFGIIIALACIAFGLFVAAMAVIAVGIAKLVISPVAGLFLIGLGILFLGIAVLSALGFWKSITVVVPATFKGIGYIFNSIFNRKECAA